MGLLYSARAWIHDLWKRSKINQELEEELRAHIEHRAGDLERSGLTPVEAERRARIEFGGLQKFKEECHETTGGHFLGTVLQDVRFGQRMLRKSCALTSIVVLTLALGIGANTAIFSLVNAIMLRSIPVRDPGQLLVLRWSSHAPPHATGISGFGDCARFEQNRSNYGGCSFSYPMFKDLRDQGRVFSDVAAFAGPADLELSGNGPARMVRGGLVSGNYFQALGVRAALGRTLEASDERVGGAAVAVLDYGYWNTAFGGSPAAIGKIIRLNNQPFTIVGVADERFTRLTPGKVTNLWVPLTLGVPLGISWANDTSDAGSWWLTIIGRLEPGVSREQAQAAVNLLYLNQTVRGAKPAWKAADDPGVILLRAQKGLVGFRQIYGDPLFVLMAAVGVVLLIACANVAGLMLARGAAREREMVVRLALGAGRGRVIRQLLTESMLLSFSGAALGTLVAYVGLRGLTTFFAANTNQFLKVDLHPDMTVLLFTVAVAVLTGIGFGLAPAFRGVRAGSPPKLKGSGITNATHGNTRRLGLGGSLVILQVALCMVILTGAGLLLRTLDKLRSIDPGFDTRNILLFSISPSLAGYKASRVQELYQNLQVRLQALPGVTSVSYSSDALLDGGLWTQDVRIQGQREKGTVETQMLAVGSDFFETMRIPLARGRTFRTADLHSAEPVAVVNEAFVRRFLGSKDPIGLHFGGNQAKDPQSEIVGIVGNTKYEGLRSDDAPTAYVLLQEGKATFALRTASTPMALIPAVRNLVASLDNNLPVTGIKTQTETIDRLLFNERLVTTLFALFGGLGLVLACIGLYGLLSYEVARRTQEIGIRAALGAPQRNLLLMILRQGLVLVIIGSALGAAGSTAAGRLLQSLLFGVHPMDPLTVATASFLLVMLGAFACYLPAMRATRVDPVVALRHE
jgi:predicted permease